MKRTGAAHRAVTRGLGTVLLLTAWLAGAAPAEAPAGAKPASGRSAAPFDPSGYWTSVVTENWRLRMIPPSKGDYLGIPISSVGKQAADAWDLTKDESTGNACKAFGAPAIMNLPSHLHVAWQDDNTLKVDIDYGTQTRLLHFGTPGATPPTRSLQGDSWARWTPRRGGANGAKDGRYLRVSTSALLAGYLRRNGVPYGENAGLLEYVDFFDEPDGGALMVWTVVVTDPVNLEVPFVLSSQFKRLPNAAAWDPTPCTLRW